MLPAEGGPSRNIAVTFGTETRSSAAVAETLRDASYH